MRNVYVAPHNSAGWGDALQLRQRQIFLDNLSHFVKGEPMDNVVDKTRGY
jgi:phosphoglycerate dehydrogenase-like enzyme